MMDNQLYYHLLFSLQRQKQSNKSQEWHQYKPLTPPFHVRLIKWLGRVMVYIGQYLQDIAQPPYPQTAKQSNQ